MGDPEQSTIDGVADGAESLLENARSIGGHAHRIHHDATTLAAELRDATADLERYLTDRVRQRPYSTLGAAVGVGYLLGGGLRSRLTVVLLSAATRFAAALAVRELGERISPNDSPSVQGTST